MSWEPTPVFTKVLPCKGSLAPSTYGLMSIENAGKLSISYFEKSRVCFVSQAITLLFSDHYNVLDVNPTYIGTKCAFEHTPDSKKYTKLVTHMLSKNLVERLKIDRLSNDDKIVILRLFAVVKDPRLQIARPIENGRPIKKHDPQLQPFSLAGATQMIELFHSFTSAGKNAYHFDLANYYFQVKNPAPQQHVFRVGNDLYCWKVLTMGWDRATRIAQSFTIDITTRGARLPADFNTRTAPPGSILFDSYLLICVYDSVLILDKAKELLQWRKRIEENRKEAHALFKYEKLQPPGEAFVFCGLELKLTNLGLEWRVDPAIMSLWSQILSQKLPRTPKTLWRLMGFFQFVFTILGLPRVWLGPARKAQSKIGLVQQEEWNCVHPEVEPAVHVLMDVFRRVDNSFFRHKRSRKRSSAILRFATDATLSHWGWYLLNEHGDVLAEDGGARVFPCIDEGEAYAVAQALLHARMLDPDGHFVVIIGGDNIPVEKAFYKGSSKSDPVYNEIVRSDVSKMSAVIVYADICSDDNFADIKSRPDKYYAPEEIAWRRSATLCRIEGAWLNWIRTGCAYTARTVGFDEESDGECCIDTDSDTE